MIKLILNIIKNELEIIWIKFNIWWEIRKTEKLIVDFKKKLR